MATEVSTNERSRTIEDHVINTTSGPRTLPKGTREDVHPDHVTNTSRVVEEDLEYSDEPEEVEILTAVSASGWYASFSDGRLAPLVLWSVWDDGAVTGVVAENGIDASRSAEDLPGFEGFVHKDNNKQGD